MAISYLDTLREKINSRFLGDVDELVFSASIFKPAHILDDETLVRAYGNSKV